MPVVDPISDFLTRIRNASKAKKVRVLIPASGTKISLAEIMKRYGYIIDYEVLKDNKQSMINVVLKYKNGIPAITGMRRISKPGLRIYKNSSEIPRVLNGLGTAVISTSGGLLTDKEARSKSVGGEVLCYIW